MQHPFRARQVAWLFLLALFALPVHAGPTYTGKVVTVSDGDTIRVMHQGGQLKIRLAEIDAPEKSQAYGMRSKQSLSDMVYGKEVRVVQQDQDRYGRIVGRVYQGSIDVNAEQVKRGMAWVYVRYANDPTLFPMERAARSARRGLWADPHPQAPWDYRHGKRNGSSSSTSTTAPRSMKANAGMHCGSKRYCGQMRDCAEARFYLTQCGLGRLDRDRDGVPCESLCR